VRRLHAGLPPSVLLVLDAAYAEFVRLPDYEAGTALVDAHDNVVMTRTFSKIHGLAALRLGWCYGSAGVIDALNRIRGPFNVNAPAMAAGVAALGDVGHVARTLAHNDRWLAEAPPRLRALGLGVTPSVGNFLLVHFPDEPGRTARDADAFLTARGFILRVVSAYGLPGALRLSIGPDEAMEGVIAALGAFMRGEA
jgi:histidinol-phosphate aminotransferase